MGALLTATDLDARGRALEMLREKKIGMEASVASSGNSYAASVIGARCALPLGLGMWNRWRCRWGLECGIGARCRWGLECGIGGAAVGALGMGNRCALPLGLLEWGIGGAAVGALGMGNRWRCRWASWNGE